MWNIIFGRQLLESHVYCMYVCVEKEICTRISELVRIVFLLVFIWSKKEKKMLLARMKTYFGCLSVCLSGAGGRARARWSI